MSMHLNPYLSFRGNAGEALEYYRSVLGGTVDIMRYDSIPGMMGDESEADKVMHGYLETPDGMAIMAADIPDSMPDADDFELDGYRGLYLGRRRGEDARRMGGAGRRRDRESSVRPGALGRAVRRPHRSVRGALDAEPGHRSAVGLTASAASFSAASVSAVSLSAMSPTAE